MKPRYANLMIFLGCMGVCFTFSSVLFVIFYVLGMVSFVLPVLLVAATALTDVSTYYIDKRLEKKYYAELSKRS